MCSFDAIGQFSKLHSKKVLALKFSGLININCNQYPIRGNLFKVKARLCFHKISWDIISILNKMRDKAELSVSLQGGRNFAF